MYLRSYFKDRNAFKALRHFYQNRIGISVSFVSGRRNIYIVNVEYRFLPIEIILYKTRSKNKNNLLENNAMSSVNYNKNLLVISYKNS